jgi:hypothetical protein
MAGPSQPEWVGLLAITRYGREWRMIHHAAWARRPIPQGMARNRLAWTTHERHHPRNRPMRPILLFLATCSAIAGLATPLAAAEGERSARVALIDTDGDGTLSPAERDAAKAARAERRKAREADLLAKHPGLDADHDGKLSRTELAEGREARLRERHPERFAEIDANRDGDLDAGERAAARARAAQRILAEHPQADADGDGTLERRELRAIRRERRAEGRDARPE